MPDTDKQDFDEVAADLALDAKESHEENLQEQEEFLDTVAEEEGAEVLETKCNIIGDYVVPLKAKLDGELMDAMGRIDARLERLEQGQGRGYEFSETAEEVSQLLSDVIDDREWHKSKFYKAYKAEGLDALGVMLERAFNSLKKEKERRAGTADGFRKDNEGA
jgi:hypothetical protein